MSLLGERAAGKGVLAWPKGTSQLGQRLAPKGRLKGSLRWPRMPWQGHLACLQHPRPKGWLAGLAGSGKWQLLAAAAGNAGLEPAWPMQAQAAAALRRLSLQLL